MQTAWLVGVTALSACAACGGVTSPGGSVADLDAGLDASGTLDAAADTSPVDSAEDSAADAKNGCDLVGKGPGLETCCEGKLCHGDCSSGWYPCTCDTAVCPQTAACCIVELSPGVFQGLLCVAPEDCVTPP